MKSARYEAPSLSVLGSLSVLTLTGGGKQFTESDGSAMQGNFSCTRNNDDDSCSGGLPGQTG